MNPRRTAKITLKSYGGLHMTEQCKLVTNAQESKIFQSNVTSIKIKCSDNFGITQAWNKAKRSSYTPLKTALSKSENHPINNAVGLVESRDAHRLG